MSIKGFSVGGNVERYDYNFLDNRPSEITVDTALSDSSTNPVQNSAVTNAINAANGSISSVSGEVDDLKSNLGENNNRLLSLRLDSLKDETLNLKPNRVIFKKIHVEKPTVINSITVHSTNHIAGQHFNVAIYNLNFTELTTMSGPNRGGAVLRYFVETGERGFLGDDTECSIPKVELCGDYLVAYKTGAQLNSKIRVVQENSYCTRGYLSKYPSRITSGILDNVYAVDIDLGYIQQPLEISRAVSVVDVGAIHVCGIDSNKKLYGYNTSTQKIINSADNGASWTDMCDYTYTPIQIVADVSNSCAYYSSGARIFKITGLSAGATITEITPTDKRHSFAMTLCDSLCLSHGYLWYGEYSTATAAPDGSYDAEASNQLNYPFLLRYNLSTGEWRKSAQFSARHIHCCVPDTNYLYIIVGDYGIGQGVGVHRLAFSDIVDNADLQDGVVQYTSLTTESFVGRIDISGQNWYNVNALIHTISGVKCLIGGSDRPLASCVITKLEDEVVGSAISFPQCFSYAQPPADETCWNSVLDDRGNLWVVTRETSTSKLLVMTPPYNKVYLVHDFGSLLPYVGGYYSSANNILWIGSLKVSLPYIGTSNSVTPGGMVDVLGLSLDNYIAGANGTVAKLDNDEYAFSIDSGNSSAGSTAGIAETDYMDITDYVSVVGVFRVVNLQNATSQVRLHVDAVNEQGIKIKEKFLAITSADVGKQITVTLDTSSIAGNVKIRAFIQTSRNNQNSEFEAVLQKLNAIRLLNQF